MKRVNIGILGATGVVGREMLRVLEERRFPVATLRLFSSARSAGETVAFAGKRLTVEEASDDAFEGLDLVLGAAESGVAVRFAPAIRRAGAVFIDNSSAFRLRRDVPLIVPEVNAQDIHGHSGIVANPNCTTIITLTAIAALARESPVEHMVVSSYQAVSGAGRGGIDELNTQLRAYVANEPCKPQVFPCPIACNVIPMIGGEAGNGYTGEEMKLQNEGRKILHLPHLTASCTCVRVPVLRSHSVSVALRTRERIGVERAKELLAAAPGCRLIDDLGARRFPTPLDAAGQDTVLVGRVREDLGDERGLLLWCCGDQLRKGAASNAVQIAELLIKSG